MDLYHALNRGVDKRTIFLDNQDRARFVHDMFVFNSPIPNKNIYRSQMCDFVSSTSINSEDKLVDIHGWCLMANHYHMLLSERVEGGISLFLRKLNVGYAKYFNERYKRTGTLFQGRTKKILIDSDAYFLHILNYIHFNPLDIHESTSDWRSRTIIDSDLALNQLHNYRWSSYQDYIGIKNFPSILTTFLFQSVFNNNYSEQVQKYLKDISIEDIRPMILE
jgi:putative transposase